jgi:phosphoserine phosphatase
MKIRTTKRSRLVLFVVLFVGSIGLSAFHANLPAWATTRAEALSMWRGDVRNQLVDFVFDVSTPGNPDFVSPNDRVAVFDMDGTLMSEKPNYFVFDVAIHYLNTHCDKISAKGPAYKDLCDAAKNHDYKYFRTHLADAFALPFEGKTYTFYRDYCRHVFETTINPVKRRPQKEMVFRPMIELVDLLQERGFSVYVVSGSLQFCIMAISEDYLHVSRRHCIGSMVVATPGKNGKKAIFRRGKLSPPPNLKEGKAMRIMMRTGQAPLLAIGNSGGDVWMLGFTATSHYRTFTGVIDHDDSREFIYRKEKLLKLAKQENWTIISMKETFKSIYGDN